MNFLAGKRFYISGPIEFGTEFNWRVEPSKFLKNEMKVDLFDPFEDPKQQRVGDLNKAREAKDFEAMAAIASDFMRKDLISVNRSDAVVAYLPYKVPTTGTHEEIIRSNLDKKPVMLVADGCIFRLPIWYFSYFKREFMFNNWDELYDYLRRVNKGEGKFNKRWDFILGKL